MEISKIDSLEEGQELDAIVLEAIGWKWIRYHDMDYEDPDGPSERILCDPETAARHFGVIPPYEEFKYVECDLSDLRQRNMPIRIWTYEPGRIYESGKGRPSYYSQQAFEILEEWCQTNGWAWSIHGGKEQPTRLNWINKPEFPPFCTVIWKKSPYPENWPDDSPKTKSGESYGSTVALSICRALVKAMAKETS